MSGNLPWISVSLKSWSAQRGLFTPRTQQNAWSGSIKAGGGVAVDVRGLRVKRLLPLLPWRLKDAWLSSALPGRAGLCLLRGLSPANLCYVDSPCAEQGAFLQTPDPPLPLELAQHGTCHEHPETTHRVTKPLPSSPSGR